MLLAAQLNLRRPTWFGGGKSSLAVSNALYICCACRRALSLALSTASRSFLEQTAPLPPAARWWRRSRHLR